jgi:hypothetical protein
MLGDLSFLRGSCLKCLSHVSTFGAFSHFQGLVSFFGGYLKSLVGSTFLVGYPRSRVLQWALWIGPGP